MRHENSGRVQLYRQPVIDVNGYDQRVRRPARHERDEDDEERTRQTHRDHSLLQAHRHAVGGRLHLPRAPQHVQVDLQVAHRDQRHREANTRCDEEERVGVVGGAVPDAAERLVVVDEVAPADEVGQHEQEGQRPEAANHQQAVAEAEQPRVRRVVTDVQVAVEAGTETDRYVQREYGDKNSSFYAMLFYGHICGKPADVRT